MKKAEDNGADVIVITGIDEGGTLPEAHIGTFDLIPFAVDQIDHTPVMAAGGIADARTARAAFALGAEGLYVGTAFLVSEESRMDQKIKEAAVKASPYDLLFYNTLAYYYRSLPGELPNRLQKMSDEGKSREEIFQASNGFRGMKAGMVDGDLSQGYASFGNGIGLIHAIEPVKVIIDRLMEGIDQ